MKRQEPYRRTDAELLSHGRPDPGTLWHFDWSNHTKQHNQFPQHQTNILSYRQTNHIILGSTISLKCTKYVKYVHINIIFSYMKFNQICNLDHPVYSNYLCWIFATCISEYFVFCIITHMGNSILKKTVSTFSKCPHERLCVQYYNMASFPVCILKSNMVEYFCS